MVTVEIVERIARPVEDVLDRLIDIDRYPEWMPDSSILITCSATAPGRHLLRGLHRSRIPCRSPGMGATA